MQKFLLKIPALLGTEQVVSYEVQQLGYDVLKVENGGVWFWGDAEAICVANINLRAAERVMISVASFPAPTFDALYEGTKQIPWENIIEKDGAFPVTGYALKSALHSVPDCQSIVKKAICDRLSQHYGIQSRLEESGAVYPIRFAIMKDHAELLIDTSGESLYKRGYRRDRVLAPLRETLAFSMISLSFWRGDRYFCDPFCGSGTIPIEAALFATNRAPGFRRSFVSETWKQHLPNSLWRDIRDEAKENENHDRPTMIYASDIDPAAIEIAKQNAHAAGVADKIHFSVADVRDIAPYRDRGVICTNPPYGERLMDKKSCEKLYRSMGRTFAKFPDAKKLILTSHEGFEQFYGTDATKRRKLYNGMLKCYLYQYL